MTYIFHRLSDTSLLLLGGLYLQFSFLAKGAYIKHLFSILMLLLTTTYKIHSTRPPGIGCRCCCRIPSTPASCCNAAGAFFFFKSPFSVAGPTQKNAEGRKPPVNLDVWDTQVNRAIRFGILMTPTGAAVTRPPSSKRRVYSRGARYIIVGMLGRYKNSK